MLATQTLYSALCVAHVSLSLCCSISCEEDTFIPPESEKLEFESENETQNTEQIHLLLVLLQ